MVASPRVAPAYRCRHRPVDARFRAGVVGAPAHRTDLLYAAAIVIGGYRIARNGYYALVRGRTLGIDLLMTIAIVGAALIGEWSEGAAVVALFAP